MIHSAISCSVGKCFGDSAPVQVWALLFPSWTDPKWVVGTIVPAPCLCVIVLLVVSQETKWESRLVLLVKSVSVSSRWGSSATRKAIRVGPIPCCGIVMIMESKSKNHVLRPALACSQDNCTCKSRTSRLKWERCTSEKRILAGERSYPTAQWKQWQLIVREFWQPWHKIAAYDSVL